MLSNLYTNQEATIRTEYGETGNIPIGKGVRQGCILSPFLSIQHLCRKDNARGSR